MISHYLFYAIFLWGMYLVMMELFSTGLFGPKLSTWAVFGRVDKERDFKIQKALAFYESGRYNAKMQSHYIVFYDVEKLDSFEEHYGFKCAFNVEDWNKLEFGWSAMAWRFPSVGNKQFRLDSYAENNSGTISYSTRNMLNKLKYKLRNEEYPENETSRGIISKIISKFKKDEVTLS